MRYKELEKQVQDPDLELYHEEEEEKKSGLSYVKNLSLKIIISKRKKKHNG